MQSFFQIYLYFLWENFLKSLRDFSIAFRLIDHLYFPSNSRFCNKNDPKNFDLYIQTKEHQLFYFLLNLNSCLKENLLLGLIIFIFIINRSLSAIITLLTYFGSNKLNSIANLPPIEWPNKLVFSMPSN